jgi:hypothetical protein
MFEATVGWPEATSSCRLDGLDLKVAGQRLEPDRAVRACQVISSDQATNQGPSRLLDDSGRTGVRPDSVQVSGGMLSLRLPT